MRKYPINTPFLHQLADAQALFEVVAKERKILPILVEKDYWIMHCLWGISQSEFKFYLKGGTSLSKGFNIIKRFSENIDIQIYPKPDDGVKIGKNQDKPAHIESRRQFFEKIAQQLCIPNLIFSRDPSFDDSVKMLGAGIRAVYNSLFSPTSTLKEGIVLELGFDQTTPHIACDITSWAFEKTNELNLVIADNRAKQVPCYCPEYTFVEKLQAISTKYRLQQEEQTMPINFLRHYYDVYKLLEHKQVIHFLGSDAYKEHKKRRFRVKDELEIKNNPAFTLVDSDIRTLYAKEFKKKSSLYFEEQIEFETILDRISQYIHRM